MNPPSNTITARTWKERGTRWLENQGVSTVLLVLILAGVYEGFPRAIEQVQQGYDRNANQLEKAFDKQNQSIERMMRYVETQK